MEATNAPRVKEPQLKHETNTGRQMKTQRGHEFHLSNSYDQKKNNTKNVRFVFV